MKNVKKEEKKMLWMVGTCHSEGDWISLEVINGSVDQVKKYLLNLVVSYKEDDLRDFDYGTEEISDVGEMKINGKVKELNAYAVFDNYHVNFTAKLIKQEDIIEL